MTKKSSRVRRAMQDVERAVERLKLARERLDGTRSKAEQWDIDILRAALEQVHFRLVRKVRRLVRRGD